MLAYVGCRTTAERNARGRGIEIYDVAADGTWHHLGTEGGLVNPSFLALSPVGDRLYVVHGDGDTVSAFAVGRDGALSMMGSRPCGGRNPVHLVVHAWSGNLFVANYATGSVARLPIGPDGALEDSAQVLDLPGLPGPHRTQQRGSHPHQILLDPAGRRAIVPDKGLDSVFVLSLGEAGALGLNTDQPPRGREGAGPRHAVFHPSGNALFLANELDSTVTTFRYDAESGRLEAREIVSVLPPDCLTTSHAAGIALTPCGRWLYVSNRGHDSVTLLAVDPERLTVRLMAVTKTGGAKPRFLTLDPDGSHLVVAHEDSDTLAVLTVDPGTGALSPTGPVVRTGSPVCVVFGGRTS
ncbi:MAG: lactonase family protein [Janthinobacterium lividum]